MKPITKQSREITAFTIVELLTVMSIIIILIGLLVPALNQVKRYAKDVRQNAQFHSIDVAMELFNTEFEGYPNSDATDSADVAYCGAMKLCEAMVGQDLLGFHPASLFRQDGRNPAFASPDDDLYPPISNPPTPAQAENLKARKRPYLQLENANTYKLADLYASFGNFSSTEFVLCDVYTRVTHQVTAQKVGMPILCYKADTANFEHSITNLDNNIYDYRDNDDLVKLGMPWDTTKTHLMTTTPATFYANTQDNKISTNRPFRSDSYILISAGFDGEYGTADDMFNFEK